MDELSYRASWISSSAIQYLQTYFSAIQYLQTYFANGTRKAGHVNHETKLHVCPLTREMLFTAF